MKMKHSYLDRIQEDKEKNTDTVETEKEYYEIQPIFGQLREESADHQWLCSFIS